MNNWISWWTNVTCNPEIHTLNPSQGIFIFFCLSTAMLPKHPQFKHILMGKLKEGDKSGLLLVQSLAPTNP